MIALFKLIDETPFKLNQQQELKLFRKITNKKNDFRTYTVCSLLTVVDYYRNSAKTVNRRHVIF